MYSLFAYSEALSKQWCFDSIADNVMPIHERPLWPLPEGPRGECPAACVALLYAGFPDMVPLKSAVVRYQSRNSQLQPISIALNIADFTNGNLVFVIFTSEQT